MNRVNTASVGLAVTPTVLQTFISHYLKRKPLHQRPTAHLSYDEGLHLIRSFLAYVAQHSVEDLQAFTAQWVPHPQWIKVDVITVPAADLDRAAVHIEAQLGPDGIRKVGGSKWWQWRKPEADTLRAEWIEMRSDYHERSKSGGHAKRVMLYVHGGAYFFGSVDMHRYQLQRHARKLKARVIAPEYRLAPQFPFPCGLHDCLATYLHLLDTQEPNTIVLAGDSAGGGMILSLLVIMRDQGIPLPAGAVLISPWCDLTHSFPSVSDHAPFDYIPQSGFHHKPSAAWPPPTDEEREQLQKMALEEKKQTQATSGPDAAESIPTAKDVAESKATHLTVDIDGETVQVKEQIQMYTTNELLSHPLVSPAMQPTLGGLPPLLIMVGGGEILRDEQVYVAHKCANPLKYMPPESTMDDSGRAQIEAYKPTDVQLQVWDDLCHVAPTLSFTRPAKHMYRSVAQFAAWALARAQKRDIEILDDDDISVISTSTSDSDAEAAKRQDEAATGKESNGLVGKAGDALPPFKNHMIRQRVTRHGVIFPLAPPSDLPGCSMDRDLVGVVKRGPVEKWLQHRQQWDKRFASTKRKVQKQAVIDLAIGYEGFGEGEFPPPSALAGRRKKDGVTKTRKRTKNMGFAMWSLWGSKHDKLTMNREIQAEKDNQGIEFKQASTLEGQGARTFVDIESQQSAPPNTPPHSPPNSPPRSRGHSRRPSRKRRVTYEGQDQVSDENSTVAEILAKDEEALEGADKTSTQHLSPGYQPGIGIGSTGKRAYVDGVAVPFSLGREAETASMMTLMSHLSQGPDTPRVSMSRPETPNAAPEKVQSGGPAEAAAVNGGASEAKGKEENAEPLTEMAGSQASPTSEVPVGTSAKRPVIETFSTALEELPRNEGLSGTESTQKIG
ncbi:hypothetical protein BD289DRAFT_456196 [Coniella lustricola]|uniref:Alpha/beta hydrolase fold-3 domain-containing protein n=1 Tax=Coniella lustricola TaxID=2025994 RepID=A0A2T2ZWS3_9PEZI|nr:hypothetical protein BD289DRAFT_456196 [Coniella lustricola]